MSEDLIVKVVHVGRTSKTVKGGRRSRFGIIVVSGDQKGKVGVGSGKATEVTNAREKATSAAKKRLVKIPLRESRTIHHDVIGVYGSSKVVMRSAPVGTGIIAGGPVRAVCEALGIKDVVAKSIGSSNPHNLIKAAFAALCSTRSPKFIAEKRGMKVGEIVSRRENSSTASTASTASTEV